MQSVRSLVQSNVKQWRAFSSCCILMRSSQSQAQSDQSAELNYAPLTSVTEGLLQVPQPEGEEKKFSPKIESLVNEITKLNLIEVGELSDLLKKKLNLPDTPLLPVGGFSPVLTAAAPEEEEEEVSSKKVQTSFTVKLLKFDEKQKVALIKEVKNLLEGMNLVQAKKFVESAPTVVKADMPKDEAEKLKEALCKVGAECVIE
ncbi:39S ribosomal protein L12, mitochondrial isoform X1 [Zootermopsis nevadensis]|uniref:39S ribosomal protein L12, mitochondrial n=1 Tax=Zootermopsis nevadensis TaxID=136037 RepID=A0A067R081_ZOONE|nr:39S ribosomal protein L12, mitochondrial isoform X1 [Zootermopsis nevadensis]KDR10841.1 39S ribosomal protein L12, mitochondrial [Zootermopsis nevadensis]